MIRATIQGSFSGQAVIDAVKAVAEELYLVEDGFDDGPTKTVGQRSNDPHKHIIVLVDSSDSIHPKRKYSVVTVQHHGWGGRVFAIEPTAECKIQEVRDFCSRLSAYLNLNP